MRPIKWWERVFLWIPSEVVGVLVFGVLLTALVCVVSVLLHLVEGFL